MTFSRTSSGELSSEVRELLYRIDLGSTTRRIAEEPALPANTLRKWCRSDEEFLAARRLAGKLGIQLLR